MLKDEFEDFYSSRPQLETYSFTKRGVARMAWDAGVAYANKMAALEIKELKTNLANAENEADDEVVGLKKQIEDLNAYGLKIYTKP